MLLTDSAINYFSSISLKVRASVAQSKSTTPFYYDDEPFHVAYQLLEDVWAKRISIRQSIKQYNIGWEHYKKLEENFISHGVLGLLPHISTIDIDPRLENLVILIKKAREHEQSNYALRVAQALKIPNVNLDVIRQIQRCWGYGHRFDENDRKFFSELQHIISSVIFQRQQPKDHGHDKKNRVATFLAKDYNDKFQLKVELFKELSQCEKQRYIRPTLRRYAIHHDRYYVLKQRYMSYGIWGLVDRRHISKRERDTISAELELSVIEERLKNPSLTASRIIEMMDLKCSRESIQQIFNRWNLSSFKERIVLHGVISMSIPEEITEQQSAAMSAKLQFPDLISNENLKVNREFESLLKHLSYRKVHICNPGAIIIAPFINQLGIVEALHTYGTSQTVTREITNNIIVNILRIIAGFPTINDFRLNSDLSVAIGSGLCITPRKSRYYDSLDDLRFNQLLKLRNDLATRAKELGIISGKEIAIDYHCDPSHTRFPFDKRMTKAPDKNKDLVYAHRPQIIWDIEKNSIINIAYCEGRSRATTALYKFLEDNLFKIIAPHAVEEIYADSEYTGEKQIVYLIMRSDASVTMCLKQNKKIQQWKEETITAGKWEPYGQLYRIATRDYYLSNGDKFRFVVKQHLETNETRCFGSTHINWSPQKILDSYHLRWPVETGIKDLIENYFLNKSTGNSIEKGETHYYCVMAARLSVDYFQSQLAEPKWRSPEEWKCTLATIRSSLFTGQNCELSLDDDNNLLITYLDDDHYGFKRKLKCLCDKLYEKSHWRVPWWGDRGVKINIKNQYEFMSASG